MNCDLRSPFNHIIRNFILQSKVKMGGRKKGLSIEEKRKRILDIFLQTADVFQLKDIEKLATEKGVVLNSVKDVVNALVDDGLVDSEKIGGQIYFWAFPSKRIAERRAHLAECRKKLAKLEETKKKAAVALEEAKADAVPNPERDEMVRKVAEVKGAKEKSLQELAKLKQCNAAVCKETEKRMTVALDSANRWTDNVFVIRSWLTEKFQVEGAMLNKRFGIPDDFDYVD